MRHNIAMQQKPITTPEKNVLVLQGGGALGAYQAGAYEALMQAGQEPEWIAGISIGAINASIIAGNKPEHRIKKLRAFWEKVSSGLQGYSYFPGAQGRTLFNETSSMLSTFFGVPGFYTPRIIPPFLSWPGSQAAVSFYDTSPLFDTLSELVDFKILNSQAVRLSIGAVSLTTGEIKYFDTNEEEIRVEHIIASGALPPAFAPVKIDNDYYWDGGLVSNTPLRLVIDDADQSRNLCIFQIDLFSSRGIIPKTMVEAAEREKEIRYASRAVMNTHAVQQDNALREAVRNLIARLPSDLQNDPEVIQLKQSARENGVTLVHLINRSDETDTQNKDNEFSRLSMEDHWNSGKTDAVKSLKSDQWLKRKIPEQCLVVLNAGKKK
jgi:NTE family protein